MTNELPVLSSPAAAASSSGDCWNRIGVRGDHSCPELDQVVHCHNCPVFARAGRVLLDAPSPEGYLEEWTSRLAAPIEEPPTDLLGVLIFRLGGEWLGLSVRLLVEVTNPRPVHRVPHRGGLLAGLVNIRGELHLCVHLAQVLGIQDRKEPPPPPSTTAAGSSSPGAGGPRHSQPRFLLVQRDGDRWVFPVDEVDEVHRFPMGELTPAPATVARALAHLSRGVFHGRGRSIGLLDDERLFQTLRARLRR